VLDFSEESQRHEAAPSLTATVGGALFRQVWLPLVQTGIVAKGDFVYLCLEPHSPFPCCWQTMFRLEVFRATLPGYQTRVHYGQVAAAAALSALPEVILAATEYRNILVRTFVRAVKAEELLWRVFS